MTPPWVDALQRRAVLARLLSFSTIASIGFPGSVLALLPGLGDSWTFNYSNLHWIALEVATGDTLLVPAEVAGSRVQAVLDSGSPTSVMSTALSDHLSIKGADQHTIRGASGRVVIETASEVDVSLGQKRRRLPTMTVADLSAVSSGFGRPIDLVLGRDMLVGCCVALDFTKRRFALAPSGSFVSDRGWRLLPLAHGANDELLISASIAGQHPTPLIFDLGSANPLMLSSNFVAEHKLLENRSCSTAAFAGVEGVRIATAFTLERAAFAGLEVTAIPTLSIDEWLSPSAVGNVGLPLIAQFDVVLDVTADSLWLRHTPPQDRPSLLKDRSGLGFAASPTGLRIVHVATGSPAAKTGWAVGDFITAVNGNPIDLTYTSGSLWRWRYAPPGTLVRLETAAGSTRDLRLADYF